MISEIDPIIRDWRLIVMKGKNTSSYKFALAQTLLEYENNSGFIRLEDLSIPFANNIVANMEEFPKQTTNPSSTFLQACSDYKEGRISEDELYGITKREGFNYVLDAFHKVDGATTPTKFFVKETGKISGITIRDNLYELLKNDAEKLVLENQARWTEVAFSWKHNIHPKMIRAIHDSETEKIELECLVKGARRINLAPTRIPLNSYQNDHCFYCRKKIDINAPRGEELSTEVDHFLPLALSQSLSNYNLNGLWNLVLACNKCNLSKRDLLPQKCLLEKLNIRNEIFATSKHSMLRTVAAYTGQTEPQRKRFLTSVYEEAKSNFNPNAIWMPKVEGGHSFELL